MQHQSLKGILSSFFQIGGKLGNKLFSRDSGIDARNSADNSYVPIRAAGADGSNGNMLATYDDVLRLLPVSLTMYPTTAPCVIPGYFKMVTSFIDPDYNTIAVDINTGVISTQDQLVASLSLHPGAVVGVLGIVNVTTIGNIRRLSGTGTANFYYKVFHRTELGVETEIALSSNTTDVDSATYKQFSASGILDNGAFLETDRLVIKYYANRSGLGNDPEYQFQFGGSTPVRTELPVQSSSIVISAHDVHYDDNDGTFNASNVNDALDVAGEKFGRSETFQTIAVIAVADWVTNVAVKTVAGITTTGLVQVAPAPASNDDWVSAQCLATSQGTNELTFTCKSTPTVDITVNIAYSIGV